MPRRASRRHAAARRGRRAGPGLRGGSATWVDDTCSIRVWVIDTGARLTSRICRLIALPGRPKRAPCRRICGSWRQGRQSPTFPSSGPLAYLLPSVRWPDPRQEPQWPKPKPPRRRPRPAGRSAPKARPARAASPPTRWAPARRRRPSPDWPRRSRPTAASVLATYRDPLGGHWQIFAGLPIDLVEPTPYQRDLSDAHVAKLCSAIDRLGRYLDPMVVVRTDDGHYWTPNGNHRLAAMRTLGARAARRHRGARARGRAPDPAAQHREGAQPPGARARGGPAGAEPGRAGRPARAPVRDRVRGGGAGHARPLLPGERPLRRRRLPPGAPADRQVSRRRRCRRRSRSGTSGPPGCSSWRRR